MNDRDHAPPAKLPRTRDDGAAIDPHLQEVAQILARGVRRLLEGAAAEEPSERRTAPGLL